MVQVWYYGTLNSKIDYSNIDESKLQNMMNSQTDILCSFGNITPSCALLSRGKSGHKITQRYAILIENWLKYEATTKLIILAFR